MTSVVCIFGLTRHIPKGNLSIVNKRNLPGIKPLGCLQTSEIFGVSARICVKRGDMFVSDQIVTEGAWEEDNVELVMRAMSLYEDAVFLDAGSNIGMYTVMVAAMGREVVAVDAMMDNLAFVSKSLEESKAENKVTLLHNAISDSHETVYPVQFDSVSDPHTNPGSLRVTGHEDMVLANKTALGPPVESCTLLDILNIVQAKTVIIKMDIQGHECKALTVPGVFSSGIFIPYIFIEWELMRLDHEASLCSNLDSVISLLKGRGYFPWNIFPLGMVQDNCLHSVLTDVLWIHKDAKPLHHPDAGSITSINCSN